MLELNGKIDRNDLAHFVRLFKQEPIAVAPCPMKNGRIYPQTTRFLHKDGFQITDIVHVKPIYYETLVGTWRSMSEVADGFGNHWINFKENWADLMHPRYYLWLTKRMKLIGGSIGLPFPIQKSLMYATVSTFYPDPDPENTSVDGRTAREAASESFATLRGAAGTTAADSGATATWLALEATTTTDLWASLARGIILFDTSAISDTDDISAAVLSLYLTSIVVDLNQSAGFTSSNPASNTALVSGDHAVANFGGTRFATDIALSALVGSAYNDWTFNADGRSNISKTSVTKTGFRLSADIDNSSPTWASAAVAVVGGRTADQTDTTQDPKLVVTHTAAASASKLFMLMGLGK